MFPIGKNIPSKEKVITNEDLLTKILLRLPVKSLLRFKSVSKHWYSLITGAHFATLRNSNHKHVSGLLFNYLRWNEYTDNYNPSLHFIPLGNNETSIDSSSTTHIPNLSRIKILNSCNGLLLCLGYHEAEDIGGYHVLNPTTKQSETLPDPNLDFLEGIALAYDPSRSPHFKVASITSAPGPNSDTFQVEIYSSETKTWRELGERFTTKDVRMYLSNGVYWNGAINWFDMSGELLYFNVEEERVGFMPMNPIPLDNVWELEYYFGESGGSLHFVNYFGPTITTTQFNVYEMRKNYSEWFVKYQVDLTAIMTGFPGMTESRMDFRCPYSVTYVLRGENNDDGSFMVLHIPGKVLLYNFVDESYKIIYEYKNSNTISGQDSHSLTAFPCIEWLSPLQCCQKSLCILSGEESRGRKAASYWSKRGGKN